MKQVRKFSNFGAIRKSLALLLISTQVLGIATGLRIPAAHAANDASALAGAVIPTALPNAFSFSSVPNTSFGGAMGSCSLQLQGVLGQLGAAFKGAAALGGTLDEWGCPKPVNQEIPSECGDLTKGAIDLLNKNAAINVAAKECRLQKLNSINGGVQCVKGSLSGMKTQVGALSSHFSALYKNADAIAGAFTKKIKETEKKKTNVERMLGEVEKAGQATEQLMSQIESQIVEAKKQVTAFNESKSQLDNAMRTIPAAYANDCFKNQVSSNASFQCTTSAQSAAGESGAKSPYDALLCQYEQRLNMTSSGGTLTKSTSASTAGKASTQANNLKTALDSILGKMPTQMTLTVASQTGTPDPSATQKTDITTLKDIKAIRSTLDGYSVEGFDVGSWFEQTMAYCFEEGRKYTKKQSETGDLHSMQVFLDGKKDELKAGIATQLSAFTKQSELNEAAMSTRYAPFDRSGCDSAEPAKAVSCLTGMKQILNDQWRGTGKEGEQVMSVGGAALDKLDDITCKGLSICQQNLKNKQNELTDRFDALTNDKEEFLTSVTTVMNSQIDSILGGNPQVVQMNKSINDDLDQINGQLGRVGVGQVQIERYPPPESELPKSENGVPMPPSNMLEYAGGKMNPALIETLDDSELTSAIKDLEKELEDSKGKQSSIASKAAACSAETSKKGKEALVEAVKNLSACKYSSQQFCGTSKDSVDELVSAIGSLSGGQLTSKEVSSLKSGVRNGCPEAVEEVDTSKLSIDEREMLGNCDAVFEDVEGKVSALGGSSRSSGDGSSSSGAK